MFNRRGFLKALLAAPAAALLGGVAVAQPSMSKGVSGSLKVDDSGSRTHPAFTLTNFTSGSTTFTNYPLIISPSYQAMLDTYKRKVQKNDA